MATYSELVIADSPLFYWKMDETAGAELAATVGSTPITLGAAGAKPTLGVAGATTALGKAVQFDGTDDIASVALDLSATATLVVEFWLSWDSFSNNDDMGLEFTADGTVTAGGWWVNPNGSAGTAFTFCLGSTTNVNTVPRPSAGVFHHIVASYDRGAAAGVAENPYVLIDGVSQTITNNISGNNAGNFANSTLYIMSRNNNSLFGAGKMQHLAIYSSLSEANAQAHYAARNNAAGFSDFWSPAYSPGRSPVFPPYDNPTLRSRR